MAPPRWAPLKPGAATAEAFPDARLKIEYNATDGDAGLQVFARRPTVAEDHHHQPPGREVLDVEAANVIRNYGLTELFSESSEPPFTEFPFEEFKQLFPEGRYTLHAARPSRGNGCEHVHVQPRRARRPGDHLAGADATLAADGSWSSGSP